MKVIINKDVQEKYTEFTVFYKTLKVKPNKINSSFDFNKLKKLILNDNEINKYKEFRKDISELDILAVERLSKYSSLNDLPKPDPFTSFIIQASYLTNIPITIFSAEEFQTINIRFSDKKDKLLTKNGLESIPFNSLIADTEKGILGVLGIKSSLIGRIKPNTKLCTILSFGCDTKTSKKSDKLVKLVTDSILIQ